MQKVVEYKLVTSDLANSLEEAVNIHISEGWVPSGIVVAFDGELIQAMVKFEAA